MKKNKLSECHNEDSHKITVELIKWKHFFEIVKRPGVWIPLIVIEIYLSESTPKGMLPFLNKILCSVLGVS